MNIFGYFQDLSNILTGSIFSRIFSFYGNTIFGQAQDHLLKIYVGSRKMMTRNLNL